MNHQKGIYFDGHEREDVVEYRRSFVEKLEELDRRCKYEDHTPMLQPGEKPLIIVHHDESTYFANADQSHYWADDSTTILNLLLSFAALKRHGGGVILQKITKNSSSVLERS